MTDVALLEPAPSPEPVGQPSPGTHLTTLIDQFIVDIQFKSIVETSEVLDFCLDLRQLITKSKEMNGI